jgi:hypothetical protein
MKSVYPWQEGEMTMIDSEARANLCRRLAELEPHNRDLWLAEAERWLRLEQAEPQHADAGKISLSSLRKPAEALLTWLRKSA